MAQKWTRYLTQIRRYFLGEQKDVVYSQKRKKPDATRAFLVRYLCSPTNDVLEDALRTIYVGEPDDAAQRLADRFERAIRANLAQYESVKASLQNGEQKEKGEPKEMPEGEEGILSEACVQNLALYARQPKTARSQANSLKNFTARLLREYSDLQETQETFVEQGDHQLTPDYMKDYLKTRMTWELEHPGQSYSVPYIHRDTFFYQTREAAVLLVKTEEERKALRSMPMPRFGNVIGWSAAHPFHLLDMVGGVICRGFAKGICWCVNQCAGENKNHWIPLGVKGLFAGLFILGEMATHTLAKVTTPGGWQEIGKGLGCCSDAPSLERARTRTTPQGPLSPAGGSTSVATMRLAEAPKPLGTPRQQNWVDEKSVAIVREGDSPAQESHVREGSSPAQESHSPVSFVAGKSPSPVANQPAAPELLSVPVPGR